MSEKQKLDTDQKMRAELHRYIDIRPKHQHTTIETATRTNDTDGIATTIYRAIEEGFVDVLEIDRRDITRYKAHIGRGKPQITRAEIQDPTPMQDDNYTRSKHPLAIKANESLNIARQFTTIADRIYAISNTNTTNTNVENRRVIQSAIDRLIDQLENDHEHDDDKAFLTTIRNDDFDITHYPRARLIANHRQSEHKTHKQACTKAKAEIFKDNQRH